MTVGNPSLSAPTAATTATATVGPPPPFDPELAAALEPLAKFLTPSITAEMLPRLRAASAAPSVPDEELHRGGAFTVQELSVPGPAGAPEVGLLVCRPSAAATPAAVVYHIHGGGMIMGDNRAGVTEILDWAEALHLVVVSVEYRLAPEHPHPAPVEDCYAGLLWTAAHAGELGVASGRIVLAGTSAGGGLA
ncbi:alpha/beta hydrolase, partial [Frankia sp. AiPs1]|uniref:alpha/beta hydrolase n=1 Tax=Frankia sp. AiPs1 TaxID=573493 RepID=UPI0020436F09